MSCGATISLHADVHPELTFRSTGVELRDDGSAVVEGELTIRGITRPVRAEGSYRAPTVRTRSAPCGRRSRSTRASTGATGA